MVCWKLLKIKGRQTMLSAFQTKDVGVAGWFGRAGLWLNFMGNITMKIAVLSSILCSLLKRKGIGLD